MTRGGEKSDDHARLVVETRDGRHEFTFEHAEVATVTSNHVVVLLRNAAGETARAVLPKSMLRRVASLKLLW